MEKESLKELFNDNKFYKRILILSLPIILQNLISSSVNMLDTVMIGLVGEVELAAVGIANQFYFIFSLLIIGISSGCGVYISQLWGKKDKINIQKAMGMGLISSAVIAIIFIFVGTLFPEKIISVFNIDLKVIKLGTDYLKIACFSYIFVAISFNYAAALRSIENSILPMLASLLGLVVNGTLNAILIFGLLGFPAMGVKGAAIATVIARAAEAMLLVAYTYKSKNVLAGKVKNLFSFSTKLVKSVSSTIMPVLINDACWGLGNLTYAVFYGRIGTQATASIQICTTIFNLFMIITFGLSNVAVIVIGKEIGAGREKVGLLYAKRLALLSLVSGIFLGLFMAVTSPIILNIFNVSDVVLESSLKILYVYSILMPIKVFNTTLIVGILRGGGDAKFGTIIEGSTLWGIGIPLTFIAAFILHLPIYIVVAMTGIEEVIRFYFIFKRFRSNKWIKNVVNDVSSGI